MTEVTPGSSTRTLYGFPVDVHGGDIYCRDKTGNPTEGLAWANDGGFVLQVTWDPTPWSDGGNEYRGKWVTAIQPRLTVYGLESDICLTGIGGCTIGSPVWCKPPAAVWVVTTTGGVSNTTTAQSTPPHDFTKGPYVDSPFNDTFLKNLMITLVGPTGDPRVVDGVTVSAKVVIAESSASTNRVSLTDYFTVSATGYDPCQYATCGPCQTCIEGDCVSLCQPGQECINDQCVTPDPCEGVVCDPCHQCQNGTCVFQCAPGQICQGGVCVTPDPCEGVTCGPCQTCVDGTCVSLCNPGQVCYNNACEDVLGTVTTLVASATTTDPSDIVTFTGDVSDENGGPVQTEIVAFFIGAPFATIPTDADGFFSFQVEMPESAGTYAVRVEAKATPTRTASASGEVVITVEEPPSPPPPPPPPPPPSGPCGDFGDRCCVDHPMCNRHLTCSGGLCIPWPVEVDTRTTVQVSGQGEFAAVTVTLEEAWFDDWAPLASMAIRVFIDHGDGEEPYDTVTTDQSGGTTFDVPMGPRGVKVKAVFNGGSVGHVTFRPSQSEAGVDADSRPTPDGPPWLLIAGIVGVGLLLRRKRKK